MKITSAWFRSALVAACLSVGAAGAVAQQAGLVNVNIGDVAVDIADVLDVDVSQVPVTVQVPIGIAANVCNVAANVLAADIRQTGDATCDAETTSTGLIRFVQQQM